MGFYLRKSIKVGPIRFNLSKSGVGVSAGVTGFRIGTGPRGNYVHMGRGGIYYRKTLPSGNGRGNPEHLRPEHPTLEGYEPHGSTVGPMVEIESGGVAQMSDSSSAELLQELQDKRKKVLLEPIVIVGAVVAFAAAAATGLHPIVLVCLATASAITAYVARRRDIFAKTVVLFYDFDAPLEKAYAALHESASKIAASAGRWHIAASGKVHDRRYHAGASSLVDRKPTFIKHTAPPFLKTNIDTVSIGVRRQTIYLFPDRALVYEAGEVGAIGYDRLSLSVTQTRFIEDSAPADARVVDRTWRYVNKGGGPDRRFSNNRELPICLYDELHFASATGLNEIIQISRCGVANSFQAALTELREQITTARMRPTADVEGSASASDQIEPSAGNGWPVAAACVAVLGAAVALGIAARVKYPQSQAAPAELQPIAASSTTLEASPSPRHEAAATSSPSPPIARAAAVASPRATAAALPRSAPPQSSPPPASAWVAKTTRALRAKAGAQEMVIPKGARLRVIGRSASDVLVSYGGSTVTIPTSATDLK